MMTSDKKYLVRIIGAGLSEAIEIEWEKEPTARLVVKAVKERIEKD
jgi:hypothetical protein